MFMHVMLIYTMLSGRICFYALLNRCQVTHVLSICVGNGDAFLISQFLFEIFNFKWKHINQREKRVFPCEIGKLFLVV